MEITLEDITKYITYIRVNFENAYKTNGNEELSILIKGWYGSLKQYPKEVVDTAVKKAVENSEFTPRLATIIKEIEKMQKAFQKSDLELWQELENCLYKVYDNAQNLKYTAIDTNGKTQGENARERIESIFNGLSSEIRDFLGSSRTLVELSKSDNLDFEKARFLKMMPEIKERNNIKENIGLGLKEIK